MNLRTWLHNAVIDLRVTDILVAIFTVVLAIVAYLQYRELHSGGEDTKKLISYAQHSADAADRSAKAAETSALAASSFSKSAKAIVVGLNTATDKMQVAVKEIGVMAESSRDSVRIAHDQLRIDRRAWVAGASEKISAFDSLRPFAVDIIEISSGKTPALGVRRNVYAFDLSSKATEK